MQLKTTNCTLKSPYRYAYISTAIKDITRNSAKIIVQCTKVFMREKKR